MSIKFELISVPLTPPLPTTQATYVPLQWVRGNLHSSNAATSWPTRVSHTTISDTDVTLFHVSGEGLQGKLWQEIGVSLILLKTLCVR